MKPIHIVLFIAIAAIALLPLYNIVHQFLKEKILLSFSKRAYYKLILGIALIAIVFVTYDTYQKNEAKYKDEETAIAIEKKKLYDAYNHAKKAISKMLKAPLTAQFADPQKGDIVRYEILDNGKVLIKSYVDSQNSFGAMLRMEFECIVDEYGTVTNIKTSER